MISLLLPQRSRISQASWSMVTSSGLLGGSYLSISPGGSDAMIPSGGSIKNTQGSVDLMSLIGRFASGGGAASSPAPQKPAPEDHP